MWNWVELIRERVGGAIWRKMGRRGGNVSGKLVKRWSFCDRDGENGNWWGISVIRG
jgi:hypothetical protein